MTLIADTGGLLVLVDRGHELHLSAVGLVEEEELLVPVTVLPEFDYMVTKRFGTVYAQRFIKDVLSGYYGYLPLEVGDVERAGELMAQYGDAAVGFVDASVVALAERHRIRRVLTTDRRHFAMFRPKGLDYLELLP